MKRHPSTYGRPKGPEPKVKRSVTVLNDTAVKLEVLQKELTNVYGHHVTYADVVEQLLQNCTRKPTSPHWRWEIQKNPITAKAQSVSEWADMRSSEIERSERKAFDPPF